LHIDHCIAWVAKEHPLLQGAPAGRMPHWPEPSHVPELHVPDIVLHLFFGSVPAAAKTQVPAPLQPLQLPPQSALQQILPPASASPQ
jgi:hypothetical protein